MEIPYTVSVRPDTGLTNGKLGIWLFLASEVMLFGALFATYILLRMGVSDWPGVVGVTMDQFPNHLHEGWPTIRQRDYLNVPLATLNTVVLIVSSVTMVMAWASLARNQFPKFRIWMSATTLLGLAFLVIKYFEYSAKFHHHLLPETNTFLAIYFTLTGLHGLHVISGMAINAYLLFPGARLWKTDPEHFTNRVEYSGLFWHFVDLVWIFLFPVLYLL